LHHCRHRHHVATSAIPAWRGVQSWREKLEKLLLDMRNKDENKAVALGTSKINYMDPRITVAWCKKVSGLGRGVCDRIAPSRHRISDCATVRVQVECPIERVFPRTLRDKFPWAMGVASDFKW